MVEEKKTRLGRGLSALLGNISLEEIEGSAVEAPKSLQILELPLSQVVPNVNQPRKFFNEIELAELAESILENGVLQPIIVEQVDRGKYQIIAGERRFRASKIAGLKTIPSIIHAFNEDKSFIVAMLENVQRSNLNPIEEAQGYLTICNQFNVSQSDVAKMLGKSRSHVSNLINILSMPQEIVDMVSKGEISTSHAKVLKGVNLENSIDIASKVVKEKLSVRGLEKLIDENSTKSKHTSQRSESVNFNPSQGLPNEDANILEKQLKEEKASHSAAMESYSKEWENVPREILFLEDSFNSKFRQMMHIQHQIDDTGKIIIHYSDIDELREVMCKLVELGDIYAR